MKPGSDGPKALTFSLLRLLADGEFHSGEAMARQLGVSRASVNGALGEAENFGLTLYRVRGRGYRLLDPPHWLDAASIARHLGKHHGDFHITILDSAPSTNTLLLRHLSEGAPSGSVLAAEWQGKGRGRMGRAWHSSLGNALTFSLLWRFDCGLGALSGLSLAVGVALIRALRTLGISGARLKWPNDVLNGSGAKLAGVLVEAQGDMLGPSAVVIGVGLNLTLPQTVLQQIDRPAAGLADSCSALPDRNHLLAAILLELGNVLREFGAHGFNAVHAEWESYHALQNRAVRLALPDGSHLAGVARGVSDEGALLLETNAEVKIIHAGEISLTAETQHATA
ncbi:MAG TPA: biotin--[acetyl-CoA-carboxylase] ligase [Gallionellaceae bacterium]